jgi:transposase
MDKASASCPITWVGMDAHKETIEVARLVGMSSQVETWRLEYTPQAVRRLARKLRRDAGESEVRCCYEAGPVGFTLKRLIEASDQGLVCEVVAPSLIPVKPGERVKTDRRDARKLASLFRACTLTEVHPPTPDQEAVRDLCRCREDAKQDLLRARHRLSKFLLRRGLIWRDGRAWTRRHWSWIRSLEIGHPADRQTFDSYLLFIEQIIARVGDLERAIAAAGQHESYRGAVNALRCFRGIDTITAVTLAAELHDISRFQKPRELMAYLGLTPSVHASGGQTHRGKITKAGNAHVRRVLVEAAWNQRHTPGIGVALRRRRDGQPRWAIAQADRAMRRLYGRYARMLHRGKPQGTIVVAIARELAGFVWATLQTSAAAV